MILNLLRRVIRKAMMHYGYDIVPIKFCPSWYKINLLEDKSFLILLDSAVTDNCLLKENRLYTLYHSIKCAADFSVDGFYSLEVGVYKGGGSKFISSVMNVGNTKYLGHYAVDTFEGHDTRDFIDGASEGNQSVKSFNATSYDHVSSLLKQYSFTSVLKGRIQDINIDYTKIGFVHLDTDLYAPTKFVLEQIKAAKRKFVVVVVDDYGFSTCPGVRKSVDEFCASNSDFIKIPMLTGQALLICNIQV